MFGGNMCPNVPPCLIDPLLRTGIFDLGMAKGNERLKEEQTTANEEMRRVAMSVN
jgi:hypothetical protein